ncbi:MAG TPA: hypothetical protein PLX56_00710 [bacterium]|nr:hypothetical protein [bacterium]HPA55865.1 hypothetical protein [bacterium]HPV20504.1 hypothetical protein [bacterium]HQO90822.1 hypothetical protein [bacterium]
MFSVFFRGALLLPFFFLSFNSLKGDDGLSNYYALFFSDADKYDKWLATDKNDRFKDIFISLYYLPDKGKRIFSNEIELRIIDSYSKNESYGYFYAEIGSQTPVEFIIYGIKKGEISINGSKKGDIKIENETGYSHLKGTFEKGVYFVSVKIEKKMDGLPVKVLSNKKLKLSEGRGFTKDAASRFFLTNISKKSVRNIFSKLYKGFCFPYNNTDSDSKELFFSISTRKDLTEVRSNKLIYFLSSLAGRSSVEEKLKKIGFSSIQIDWWKKSFFEREVCFDERYQ